MFIIEVKCIEIFPYIDDVVRSIELLINKIPKISKKEKYKWDSISDIAPFRIVNIGNEKKFTLKILFKR